MTKPWVDQPYELIPVPKECPEISKEVQKVVTEMCLAHNLFIRNMNAIVLQCTHISLPADISDFLTFCKAFHMALHHHHWGEEQFLFPEIEKYTKQPGIMEVNVTQHAAFEGGLKKFNEYVTSVSVEEYDGERLKGLMGELAEPLVRHLKEEIQTLLGLEKFGGKGIEQAWKILEAAVMHQMGDKSLILPVGLGATDRTFEGGRHAWWPPFPFFVPYLVKYWFMREHKGAWRFSPCDVYGKPRELQFLGEK